jgi:hypothetical protein
MLRSSVLILVLLAGSETEMKAYTDPGSGALIWQMLAAAFVGAGFYYRRLTSWIKRKKKTRSG